jgi:hypothetical protein
MKTYYVYRQEFKYKVSYIVLGDKDYVPKDSKKVATCWGAKVKVAQMVKDYLDKSMIVIDFKEMMKHAGKRNGKNR